MTIRENIAQMNSLNTYKNFIYIVATQFLTHVLINFQKNSKIAKNIENPKKYVFNTFASFF